MEIATERHSSSRSREPLIVVDSAQLPELHPRHKPPSLPAPQLRLREHCRRGRKGYKSQRMKKSAAMLCPLERSGSVTLDTSTTCCLHKTGTAITPMSTLVWKGKFHRAPILVNQLQDTKVAERENQPSQGVLSMCIRLQG